MTREILRKKILKLIENTDLTQKDIESLKEKIECGIKKEHGK